MWEWGWDRNRANSLSKCWDKGRERRRMRDDLNYQQEKCIFLRQQPQKFRGCSRHGKSLSCLQKSFSVPDIRPFSCCEEKGGSDPWSVRNASEGAPAKLQGSYCAAVKFKGKDRRGGQRGGGEGRSAQGAPARLDPPQAPHPLHRTPGHYPAAGRGDCREKGGTVQAGGEGKRKTHQTGSELREFSELSTALGSRQRVRGQDIYIFPSWLGVGGDRSWERK